MQRKLIIYCVAFAKYLRDKMAPVHSESYTWNCHADVLKRTSARRRHMRWDNVRSFHLVYFHKKLMSSSNFMPCGRHTAIVSSLPSFIWSAAVISWLINHSTRMQRNDASAAESSLTALKHANENLWDRDNICERLNGNGRKPANFKAEILYDFPPSNNVNVLLYMHDGGWLIWVKVPFHYRQHCCRFTNDRLVHNSCTAIYQARSQRGAWMNVPTSHTSEKLLTMRQRMFGSNILFVNSSLPHNNRQLWNIQLNFIMSCHSCAFSENIRS